MTRLKARQSRASGAAWPCPAACSGCPSAGGPSSRSTVRGWAPRRRGLPRVRRGTAGRMRSSPRSVPRGGRAAGGGNADCGGAVCRGAGHRVIRCGARRCGAARATGRATAGSATAGMAIGAWSSRGYRSTERRRMPQHRKPEPEAEQQQRPREHRHRRGGGPPRKLDRHGVHRVRRADQRDEGDDRQPDEPTCPPAGTAERERRGAGNHEHGVRQRGIEPREPGPGYPRRARCHTPAHRRTRMRPRRGPARQRSQ